MIPLEKCVDRGIYRLISRNLTVGVFKLETSGFIGIRLKFGQRFLDQEYHYDCGPPHGTARPQDFIGMLPEELELREHLQSVDENTRRPTGWSKKYKAEIGWGWYWLDTGKPDPEHEIHSVAPQNTLLFEYLDKIESGS